ncbi:MAG: endonuclease MutS2 [Clostridia bacterium]|nr:endonuclease MutS2 [Clostridia bacterium]
MNQKALTTLEFNKITAICRTYAASEMGRELLDRLEPLSEVEAAELRLSQTWEADSIYRRIGRSPIDCFSDIRGTLARIHAAYSLSMGELLEIAALLRVSQRAKTSLSAGNPEDVLVIMAQKLASHRDIEEEIGRCILSEEEMADSASPELSRIRRRMHLVNERVRDKLNSIIRNPNNQKYLQDPIITMRNGRYAIPVKAEYRGQIGGLIHDQSGSGLTVFIEPSEVVELGNEFKKLLLDEKREIERILSGLTALVAPYAQELGVSLTTLAELDAIFARAAMARDMRAVRPKLNREGRIRIVNGRHPLLDKDKVVPLSVNLGESFDTLIITGPNTGGKTVTLKTVGLFSLMAAAGYFIPADEGVELGVFDEVFADIGDEQSIEQSLSTFSSHMSNLVRILRGASDKTLVLLDELGAGTDPVEGAALAQAILEHLHAVGAPTMATTHYSEIKAFALTRAGMQNASMEFDVNRLCPTYRLFIGIPGKSNAFEISQRLGLEAKIIERAREFLKGEEIAFEDVLRGAEEQRRKAEEYSLSMQREYSEASALRAELEREKEKLQAEKSKLRERAKEDARQIVRSTRREMEDLIAKLRELKNIDAKALERAIQQSKDAMRVSEEKLMESMERDDAGGVPVKSVRSGETVYVASIHGNATVLKAADAKGMVQVQAGAIKLSVPLGDLREVKVEERPKPIKPREILTGVKQVELNLDVRGMTVDDASMQLDRYIDECELAGRKEFYVIHGKGTGALRAGLQQYLRRHPKVGSFRAGTYGEGDAGVTVVTLK